jgi:hypothetical protein
MASNFRCDSIFNKFVGKLKPKVLKDLADKGLIGNLDEEKYQKLLCFDLLIGIANDMIKE